MCAKTSPSTAVLPSVPVRPQKDGAVPSWLRTDGKPPPRPVLSDVGRTGRLTTLEKRQQDDIFRPIYIGDAGSEA
jgi:hypothetical protein